MRTYAGQAWFPAILLLFLLLVSGCAESEPDDSPPSIIGMATVEDAAGDAQQYLFVIHRKHDMVSRVNMETMAVTHIDVGDRPFTMDITPDGRTVVVVNRGDRTVSIIDTLSAQVRNAYVGQEPRDVTIRADGRYAAVANFENNSFTLIDLEQMHVEAFLCPDGPTSVEFTADGSRLLCASYWTARLRVFDMDELETEMDLTLTSDSGSGAQDVVVGPADTISENLAFVALRAYDGDYSELVTVDWTTGDIVARNSIGPAPAMLAVSPDGTHVFALGKDLFHGPNWVAEFEILEGIEVRERFRYNIDRDPTSILVHPTNGRVYVACRKKDKIKALDTDNKFDNCTIHTWERPYTLGINPEGTILFVAHDDDEHGRLTLIDTETNEVIRVKKLF